MEQSDLIELRGEVGRPWPETRTTVKIRQLRAAAGWIITGSLIYAPFAFGSVSTFAIHQLNIALTVATCCWILDCVLSRRAPKLPIVVVVCGLTALPLGWFMAWNARSMFMVHYLSFVQTSILPHKPGLPGALEMQIARQTMERLDSLFGGLLVAADLAAAAEWRNRWVAVISITGALIAAFGVAQQAGLATFVATRMSQMEGEYFATYNYHGNAGAYMNIGLAVSFAVCLFAFEARKQAALRCASTAIFAVTLIGILANTSRGAQAVSVLILIGMGLFAAMRFVSAASRFYRYRYVVWPLIGLLSIVALGAAAMHSARNAEKWRELPSELAKNSSRWQVWRVAAPMARSAGALGHGPGSFKLLLPASPMLSDALLSRWVLQPRIVPEQQISMWSMAHNDYLQTWVEFGWLGLILAGTILFGGIACGINRTRDKLPDVHSPDGFIQFGVTAALLGVSVHSLFDFPLQVASIQVTVIVMLGICWRCKNV